jgi:hypothetical protein
MNHEEHDGQNITVGDIKKSKGVAIGRNVSVSVNPPPSPAREELIALLSAFIQSLGSYENTLSNSLAIRKEAAAARAEAERPSPRWGVIRSSLKGIAASVASVAALTDAINNLQALVDRIAH